MSKTRKIILGLVITVAVLGALGLYILAPKPFAVQIGSYKISENELRQVTQMMTIQKQAVISTEEAAVEIAKMRIVEQDLKQIGRDAENRKQELLKQKEQEKENFNRNKAENLKFCQSLGITQQELIDIAVASKMNILLSGEHFTNVTQEYVKKHQQENGEKSFTPEELETVYTAYMDNLLNRMSYTIGDEKVVSNIESENALLSKNVQSYQNALQK